MVIAEKNLADQKQSRDGFNRIIEGAKKEVRDIKLRAKHLASQLKISEQTASLAEFSSSVRKDFTSELAKSEEVIQDKIDGFTAAAGVSQQLSEEDKGREADKELERKADAEAILAKFRT